MTNEMTESIKNKSVLVLNADYSILSITSLQQILKKYCAGRIQILKCLGDRILHPSLDIIGIPVVVKIKNYKYVPFRPVKLNRKNVFQRDSHRCQYCARALEKNELTLDHVIPKSHRSFPGHVWENIVTACKKCNNLKANKTPEEAGMRLLKHPITPKSKIIKMREEWREFANE